MPVPSTVDQFLELACKSDLLDPQHLQAYLRRRGVAGALPDSPRALADAMVDDGLLTRFQVEQLLHGRWRNFLLNGKYKVLGPVGSGGMGHVYLCEHLVMRRRVAVKVLPVRPNDQAARERFQREARAVAHLHHANIVVGHDIDQVGQLHFLVMEYVDGSTFQKIITQHGPMAFVRASQYIRQAALGLQHAHEAGLVHRDIKPSNLVLDRSGTVKILDLGLARFFHDDSDDLSKRHNQSPVGTSDYMAPEQALNSHQVDIRADIYSLGATFYYLLAGHHPFQGGTEMQKLIWHQFRRPRPIREIRAEVPEPLAAVVERMMAKEPAERYPIPAEVVQALAPWTETPILPPPAKEMPELVPEVRSGRYLEAARGLPVSLYGPDSASAPAGGQRNDGNSAPSVEPDSTSLGVTGAELPASPGPRADIRLGTPEPPFQSSLDSGELGSASTSHPRPMLPSPPSEPEPSNAPTPRLMGEEAAESSRWPWMGSDRVRRRLLLVAAAVLVLGTSLAGIVLFRLTRTKGLETVNQAAGSPAAGSEGSTRLRLLVPAYFYPAGEGLEQWDRILASQGAATTVVIANPESGPGKMADPNYAKVLERARRHGVTVIGYVPTKYTSRPLHEVKADVDRWIHYYPSVQGIFFDEQSSAPDQVHYYVALYEYTRKERGLSLVVTNPGTVCAEEYLARPASDIVCLIESAKDLGTYRRPAWAERYPAERFGGVLCQTDSSAGMKKNIVELRDKKIGYGYVTDAKLPNPWSRLPSYWEAEVEAVRELDPR